MMTVIGGQLREVHIEYRRNRNIYLRINEDGSLKVTCPRRVTHDEINRFIHEKEAWILNTENAQRKKAQRHLDGTDRKHAVWMGETRKVRIEEARKSYLTFDGDTLVFHLKTDTEEEIRRVFYNAASRQLVLMIQELRGEWDREICQKNGRPLPKITVKYMTSRWGSCTPAKNHISMSSRLIHYPLKCLEYVLLHEYAHILVANHSAAFYSIIERYMPDYREVIRSMK